VTNNTATDRPLHQAPTALIFDWDNTLVDSWATIHEALAVTFTHFGHKPWSMDEVKDQVRQSLRDSFPHYFGDKWEEARDIYLGNFEAIHLERCKPLAGASELLNRMTHEWGLPAGIVSNKTGRLLRKEVDYLGWSAHFVSVLGAGDAVSDKPNPAPVEIIRKELTSPEAHNIWFVGDTDIDMACAHHSDCRAILIHPALATDGAPTHLNDLNGWSLDHHFQNIDEMAEYLATLIKTE